MTNSKGNDDEEAMPEVSMRIQAKPENVAVVRRTLGGLADRMPINEDVLTNMQVAVSEACANVVVHAYESDGQPGDIELEIKRAPEAVTVVVRDEGAGFRPTAVAREGSWRLGLPLIAALTDGFEVLGGRHGRGTEVRMTFAL